MVEVFQGYSGREIPMIDGFEDNLTVDLNGSKQKWPTEIMEPHSILVYYSSGSIDTIHKNGKTHQFHGWYQSDENLIEKYGR